MSKLRSGSLLNLAAMVIVLFSLLACGEQTTPVADTPTATAAGGTPAATSPTATKVDEAQGTSRVSLDEYLRTACGQSELGVWEEGDSLKEISAGLEFISEQMSALVPPAEIAEWHDAQLAFASAFKKTIDDFFEDPKGRSEDEFLLSTFSTLAPHFQPVEQAIAGMGPDVRDRMIESGCIDKETSEPIQTEVQREEIPVGASVEGTLGESEDTANFQFQAENGQKYLIEVSWEGLTRIRLLIKDPPDPAVSFMDQSNSSDSPFVRRWTAPESGTFQIELYALEGTGSFTVSVAIDPTPDSPAGVSAVWEGSTMKISWDPVDGAEYYILYHDDRGPGCELNDEGHPRFCDELASDVAGISYTHAAPDPDDNFYFVVACNSEGCSEIDSNKPASP